MLDEDVKETYPTDELLDKCEVFRDLDRETLKLYYDAWIKIKSK